MTAELIAAVRSGPERVVAVLAGRPEAERRTAAARLLKLYRGVMREWTVVIGPDGELEPCDDWRRRGEQQQALQLALLGVGTGVELHKLGRRALPMDHDGNMEHAYEVIVDRRPEWLAEWTEMALDESGWVVPGAWPLVRRLIREGLIERPESDTYVRAVVRGVWEPPRSVRDGLEADPTLLDWELWRLFEVEGGENSLASIDAGGHGGWACALVELAAAGRIDRGRLLDASLDALSRDFSAYQAGWFARLHEALKPAPEERAARAEAYLGLVASPALPTVAFSVKALAKTPGLDAGALLAALPAALAAERKGVVRDALALLDRLDAGAEERAAVAATALQHPAPDVQLRALELIAKWTAGEPGPDTRAELLAYAEVVAPTARAAFDALTGAPPVLAEEPVADLGGLEARAAALPAPIRAALGIDAALAGRLDALPPLPAPGEPALTALEPLAPVEDLDALADVLGRVVEGGAPHEELERGLDGISRLCHSRAPFERELKPLLARLGRPGVTSPLLRAIVGWSSGRVPPADKGWYGKVSWPWAFLDARVTEVANRAAALRPAPLLATPTHLGCLIAPAALVARAASLDGDPGHFDLVQALHRLAPEGREAALAAAAPLSSGTGEAIQYALGGPRPGSADPFVVAAARPARHSFRPRLATDYRFELTADPPAPDPVLEQPSAWLPALVGIDDKYMRGTGIWPHQGARILQGTWPGAPVLSAIGATELAPGEYSADSMSGASAWLAPLALPGTEIGGSGALLIAAGLTAQDRVSATAAQEVLAAVIADGRLGPAGLAEPLRFFYDHGWAHAARLGPRLAAVGALSPLHAEVVRQVLEGMLGGGPDRAPRDLHALLEPLNELAHEAGAAVRAPAARALLEGFSGRSKTARLAAELLAREGGSRLAAAAAAMVAEARVARGEAWSPK